MKKIVVVITVVTLLSLVYPFSNTYADVRDGYIDLRPVILKGDVEVKSVGNMAHWTGDFTNAYQIDALGTTVVRYVVNDNTGVHNWEVTSLVFTVDFLIRGDGQWKNSYVELKHNGNATSETLRVECLKGLQKIRIKKLVGGNEIVSMDFNTDLQIQVNKTYRFIIGLYPPTMSCQWQATLGVALIELKDDYSSYFAQLFPRRGPTLYGEEVFYADKLDYIHADYMIERHDFLKNYRVNIGTMNSNVRFWNASLFIRDTHA